ncbi:hypothetical protein UPYG_G00347690 [Umbra pygmaea]|uniref:RAD9, HUS1, RAD1-interacting nuclear orphan protein 1 n=1 Tax=Umbra pygmaea TaxID=75934 RepID=A0ABD0VY19_UMBPY
MPRKTRKSLPNSQKTPLLFVEPPLDGARYHNVPQVRGARNPKSFLVEDQRKESSSTACNSWVCPQFDQLLPSVPRGRRLKKTCQSGTSHLDRSPQLSRSVCKFPSLSFARRSTAQALHQQPANGKNKNKSGVGAQEDPHDFQVRKVGSVNNQSDTKTTKLRTSIKRTADRRQLSKTTPEDEASNPSRCVEVLKTPGNVTRPNKHPASYSALTAGSTTHCTPVTDNVFSPPDVETPELHHDGSSSSFLCLMLTPSQPMTPPHNLTLDILAEDTPERDYGIKVTWRRRKGLMRLLRKQGNISSTEAPFNIP